jgi:Lon protease-like protein
VVEQNAPFGVVRARNDGIFRVGCTAVVERIVKAYEDGRMDIATTGQMPFRIDELHRDMPYLAATVQPLGDDPQPGPAKITSDLRALFEHCYRLAHGAEPPDISSSQTNDPERPYTYQLAAELPLELDALQELLEIRTEAERRSRLLEQLGALFPRLVRIAQMREKTGANGHGLN